MTQNALKRELKAQLAAQGFSVEIDRWPRKLIYYKKNGEAMPNMPADPVTMHRYLNVKGFTLVPPEPKDDEAEFQELLAEERNATLAAAALTASAQVDNLPVEEAELVEEPLLSEEKVVELFTEPPVDPPEDD